MIKNITFNLDKTKLTVINGDAEICKNLSVSGKKIITINTELITVIKLKPDLYCDYEIIPELKFYNNNGSLLYTESFIKNDNFYVLTVDFQNKNYYINNDFVIICRTFATIMYGYVKLELINCKSNIISGNVEPEEKTFIITCDDGYEFQTPPLIIYGGIVERLNNNMFSDYFIKSENNYIFTITIKKNWIYKIQAECSKKTVILDKYGLLSAYCLTFEDLRILATKRFVKPEYKPVEVKNTTMLYNINYDYVDTAKFIISLHKLNIPIFTQEKQKIKFGIYDMDIEVDTVNEDIQVLDFGNIFINGIYNNSIDYEHTEIKIYLPYIGVISLDTNTCMNKLINLKYKVNILNGDCLVLIYADDNLIMSQSCNIAEKIPYKMSDNEEVFTQLELNNNYLHNEQPFIITRTNKATQSEDLPYHDTKYYSILGNLSGYTEATEIDFNIIHDFITLTEIEEIKSLIYNGIKL